jgi:hypothetical protein
MTSEVSLQSILSAKLWQLLSTSLFDANSARRLKPLTERQEFSASSSDINLDFPKTEEHLQQERWDILSDSDIIDVDNDDMIYDCEMDDSYVPQMIGLPKDSISEQILAELCSIPVSHMS